MAEPMAVDASDPFEHFNLESYVSEYTSRTQIERLLFIAEHCERKDLELQAYKQAVDLIKQGCDVERFKQATEKIGGRLGPAYEYDESWVEKVQSNLKSRLDALESQLQTFKTHMIKDDIRTAHVEIAVLYYESGDLQESMKEYSKARDYCTTAKQSAQMCLNMMRVALEMKTIGHLTAQLRKAEQIPTDGKTKAFHAQVHCYQGLKELESKKYEAAAKQFVQVDPEICDVFTDVMTAQDVALYGSLCALATFPREDLKSQLISSVDFKELLSFHPEIRNCVHDFYRSQYSTCLSTLTYLKPVLFLDLHLRAHVEELYRLIRQKALIQFTRPFTSVSMQHMAQSFNISVGDLEKEIVEGIANKSISAKIDSEKQILYMQIDNARQRSFSQTVVLTQKFLRENKALLVRLNLIKHNMIQKPSGPTERRPKKIGMTEIQEP